MKLLSRDIWDNRETNYIENIEICPFCKKENLRVWEGKYFFITHNKYPYRGIQNHLMVIPYRHITHTSELHPEECGEFPVIEKFIKDFFGDSEYFSFIRQTRGGKSIGHIHYHYLPGILYPSDLEKMLEKQGY